MCVQKTRGYVKNNKKKLINAVVGWGRPVYTGEENASLLSKLNQPALLTPGNPVVSKDLVSAYNASAKSSNGNSGKTGNKIK